MRKIQRTRDVQAHLQHAWGTLSSKAQRVTLTEPQLPFKNNLARHFRVALDVYLEILHGVDVQVDEALGRSAKDWRIKNICPTCSYELVGERGLKYRRLFCIDGNNSLKSIDDAMRSGTAREDGRTGRRDIWITQEEVDKFANDVQGHPEVRAAANDNWSNDDDITYDEDGRIVAKEPQVQSDETPGVDGEPSVCLKRWWNAGPDSKKRMWAMYAATGIFAAFCRHGFLQTLCDMIRSGERYVVHTQISVPLR